MDTRYDSEFDVLNSIECENKVFNHIVSFSHELGFDSCIFILRMPLPLTRLNAAVYSNCPMIWKKKYQAKECIGFDPIVEKKFNSLSPVVWSDKLFSLVRGSWAETHSLELRVGWSKSNRDACGVVSILILGRSDEPITNRELQNKELKMVRLAQAAHSSMSQILTTTMMPEIRAKLTEREVEVLRWTADGKTSPEISKILNITERTVNFHMGNAMSKLNSVSKTAAVVRATTLGFLW